MDDIDIQRDLASRILTSLKYRVVKVADGEDAVVGVKVISGTSKVNFWGGGVSRCLRTCR